MGVFEVDCDGLDDYIDSERIEFWNLIVTEGRNAPEKADGEFDSREEEKQALDQIEGLMDLHESQSPELEFSKEHDWFYVRNEGTLGSLLDFILPHECKENNDMLHLTAVIMSTIAESQIFADGNKRTAYLAAADFLSSIQLSKGMEKTVIPALDKELTQILQEIAEKKSSREELYTFLEGLRPKIKEYAEEEGVK